ncbi:MAG: ribonuclease HI [Clostridiales bacterium]|jgi:ribonuclease HI|nr:ribonuclease HI [Clostridiales bacterium]
MNAPPRKSVIIYTDGACSGNPGPGGYGALLRFGPHEKELSAGYKLTTNNRMEIMAAIAGLEALREPCAVEIYSDSRYLVDAVEKGWARAWRKNGWRRGKSGEPALNPDLWERLLKLLDKHEARFVWVKGHASNPGNERCDRLAVAAAKGANLLRDDGYGKGGA